MVERQKVRQELRTIFLTDLDGTLLHFDDFNFAAARTPILKYIDQGIEIIPVSSKTKLEIIMITQFIKDISQLVKLAMRVKFSI